MSEYVKLARMQRKLDSRDAKIRGLERRVLKLESALASRTLDLESLSRNVSRAVTEALCNVRMIPVFGVGKGHKIVEITHIDAPRK